MIVRAEILENQKLKLYLISYRSLTPVLEINTAVHKNEPLHYELYFRDENGNQVTDEILYRNFTCQFSLSNAPKKDRSEDSLSEIILDTSFSDGCIQGETIIEQSGNWFFYAYLEDSMGSSAFEPIPVVVENCQPEGTMPEMGLVTRLTGECHYTLDEYFSDSDGDVLSYVVESAADECAEVEVSGNVLTVHPKKAGVQTVFLTVSDGESTSVYEWEVVVTPLWQAYLKGAIAAYKEAREKAADLYYGDGKAEALEKQAAAEEALEKAEMEEESRKKEQEKEIAAEVARQQQEEAAAQELDNQQKANDQQNAIDLENQGNSLLAQGQYESAITFYQTAQAIYKRLDLTDLANNLNPKIEAARAGMAAAVPET